MHHETWSVPRDGENFNVKNMSVKNVYCGNIAGDSKNNPPIEAVGFTYQVIILKQPDKTGIGYALY